MRKKCKQFQRLDISAWNVFLWWHLFFYLSVRTVLCYLSKLCYFLRLSWNFFLDFLLLLNNEMTNKIYFCVSVIVWFCDCFVCVTLVVSSFLCLNIFQSPSHSVQIFLNAVPRDFFPIFKFLRFFIKFLASFWGQI